MATEAHQQYKSFEDFYPYYLSEHSDLTCRRLHFAGSTLVLAIFVYFLISFNPMALLAMPIAGYGFAWVGHFFFEKNKPATFQYPLYSLAGDWVMYKDMLSGKIKF